MVSFANLGPALTRLRQNRGWSQRELARRADCTPPMVGSYESGRLLPSATTLSRLLAALEVDRWGLLDALLDAEGTPRGALRLLERQKRSPEHQELLTCLELDLPPQAEATFLAMADNLASWFQAEGQPRKRKARNPPEA